MSLSLRYLEEAKIEELADEYARQGYAVEKDYRDSDVVYDLVAVKDQQKLAIEVQARAALAGRVNQITRQREVAQAHGYGFQLVIVNPPREKEIRFEGFATRLHRYLIDHFPAELDLLATHTSIDAINRIDLRTIAITEEGIDIAGVGMVEMTLAYGSGEGRDGISLDAAFPLDFALSMNHQREIVEIETLTFDTSGFDD